MINSFTGEYRFLSNFYPCTDPRIAPSLEHHFQKAKTQSPEAQTRILQSTSPGKSKRLGRKVDKVLDWDLVKANVMLALLRIKFEDPDLRQRLLATGNHELVEGNNHHDNYWGDCFCKRRGECGEPGLNKLGILLMKVRAEIRGMPPEYMGHHRQSAGRVSKQLQGGSDIKKIIQDKDPNEIHYYGGKD